MGFRDGRRRVTAARVCVGVRQSVCLSYSMRQRFRIALRDDESFVLTPHTSSVLLFHLNEIRYQALQEG